MIAWVGCDGFKIAGYANENVFYIQLTDDNTQNQGI